MRIITIILIILFAWLQYKLWLNDGGLLEFWQIKEAVVQQKAENQKMSEKNQTLAAEVEDLKLGVAALEERARDELGMIKEDETFYQVVDQRSNMLTILVSNDDGVDAPGLAILEKALWELANIVVVAPNTDYSGSSHSLTLNRPLRMATLSNGYISINGTPSDCVHMALTGLLETEPDMVVSGINSGANLGDDVLYSGTVAAAMEGRFLGLPSLAISSVGKENQHYEAAARVTVDLMKLLQLHPLPADTILNVNVPDLPYEELRGWRVTRLGNRHKAEPVIKQQDPRGNPVYWVGLPGPRNQMGEDTDFFAVNAGYVSITPLHADLTQHSAIASLQQWVQKR